MKREDVIYARQSAVRIDSISIESQIEYCKYELKGQPCRVYIDKGFSGKDTDRPQFQEMIEAVKRGEIRRVICYKLDRISRSVIDFVAMMEILQQYDVEFLSCTEKFDTSTPTGRAMLSICIVFAQLERETIQMRVDDAYKSMSRKGFFMGGRVPYGFRREPYVLNGKNTTHFIQDITEASSILMMCMIFQEPSATSGDVIRELDRNGIINPNSKDETWLPNRIMSIICNPIYVKADIHIYNFFKENGAIIHSPPEAFNGINGCYLFEDKEAGKKRLRIQGHHLVVAPHEGFVPSDIWLRCRMKVKYSGEAKSDNSIKENWLSRKIKCGKCGYALFVRKQPRSSARNYMCSKAASPQSTCTGVGKIPAEHIEQIVLDELFSKISRFPIFEQQQEAPSVSLAVQKQIDEVQAEIDQYMKLLIDANSITANYINERILTLDRKKADLSLEIYSAKNEDTKRNGLQLRLVEQMGKWNTLSITDKMSIVDSMIEKICVTEDKVQIEWKI